MNGEPDPLRTALRELGAKASRLSVIVGLLSVALGILTGALAVVVLAGTLGYRIAGAAAALSLFGVSVSGRHVANALIRARRRSWVVELARKHHVPRDPLADAADGLA